jgi:hypothetical protein
MILAQRLVRRLCSKCATPGTYSEHYLHECLQALNLEATPERLGAKILEPIGCEACRGLGYRGRVGIFEILRVDDTIHELIVQKRSARDIRQEALKFGMTTLQQSGWEQLALAAPPSTKSCATAWARKPRNNRRCPVLPTKPSIPPAARSPVKPNRRIANGFSNSCRKTAFARQC